jgi:nitrous oxide reductase accessory protein NosL
MKYLLIVFLSIFSYGIDLSENAISGKEIYMEANCQKCHNIDAKYDPKAYAVKDKFTLNKWVSSCMTYFGHSWFPEEKQDVVTYLNEIKYKLDLDK